ncbi:branched-chain amino acid transport system II carrier protein, partial [Bacillus mycoides]|uniref:branched-chain amino acid transport system II carrier protein n=1 Tax=Bacillus mycoides TaxID=1405 RepID=UPI003CC7EDDC
MLTNLLHHLFRTYPTLLLPLPIPPPSLTTSLPILPPSRHYFSPLLPKLSYQKLLFIFCPLAFILPNLPLTHL